MPIEFVDNLEDHRLWPYRQLKDRELARDGERFVAEGEFIVRRLIASEYPVESVLITERRADALAAMVPSHVPLYILPDAMMHRVIGFKFHSGVIACGRRIAPQRLDTIVSSRQSLTLVICPETANAENLGSLIRISAAFSADAILLGERCCDPFWRQSVRVSMGTVFSLPIVRSENLLADMKLLQERWGVELIAAMLGENAESLRQFRRKPRTAIVFGNEAQGLAPEQIDACDRRVTIPMKPGIDSLNVAAAAAIFLYELA